MTKSKFDFFLDQIKALGIAVHKTTPIKRYSWENIKTTSCDPYLYIEWTTGGISGGSCWDEGESRHSAWTSDDPEPEFEDLNKILENICPALSFMQYNALLKKVIVCSSYTESEYYGNSTNHSTKTVNLKTLFEELSNLGVIK